MKTRKTIETMRQLPVEYNHRNCTDALCIWTGMIFTFVILVSSIVAFNYSAGLKVNLSTDSEGRLCGVDLPFYPYVYFINLPNINKRVCVSQCPQKTDQQLECMVTANISCKFSQTKGLEVLYYESQEQYNKNRSGFFCIPTQQSQKQKLEQYLEIPAGNLYDYKGIVISTLVALALSIFYALLVQLFPTFMSYFAVIGGIAIILVAIISIIIFLLFSIVLKIFLVATLLIFFLIFIRLCYLNLNSWKIHHIFFKGAVQMIPLEPSVICYLLIFIVVLVFFIALIMFQFQSIWILGTVNFDPQSMEKQSHKIISTILSILVVIQCIWGSKFIKQAFNFCISFVTVLWYYKDFDTFVQPIKLLFCKHLGSVIGGSFMTSFFSPIVFVLDFVKPSQESCRQKNNFYNQYLNCLCLSHLVRSQAMTYIHLTGNSYCESANYCNYLYDHSNDRLNDAQMIRIIYKICYQFLLVGIATIISQQINGQLSLETRLVTFFVTLNISSLFISLHIDTAQAIQIIFLLQRQLNRRSYDQKEFIDRNLAKQAQKILRQIQQQNRQNIIESQYQSY